MIWGTAMPARSILFSSSSSVTLRSKKANCAFRRSREFWAAIRFLWALASLRSSELMGLVDEGGGEEVRGRLRDVLSIEESWDRLREGAGEDMVDMRKGK